MKKIAALVVLVSALLTSGCAGGYGYYAGRQSYVSASYYAPAPAYGYCGGPYPYWGGPVRYYYQHPATGQWLPQVGSPYWQDWLR